MKNEEDNAEVRKIETLRHRQSQLEVKPFTENLKNEGTETIRLEHRLDHSFFFSSIAAFSAFHRSKKKKTSFDE